jgi:hypothetical protein
MKRALSAALFLTLAAAAQSAAAPSPTRGQFLQSLAAPACEAALPGAVLGDALPATTGGLCLGRFCTTDSQCACSAASSYACVGGTCHYTYPGGGGTGGPHCPGAFCTDDAQCQSNCPGDPSAHCGAGGTCVY